jgi:hypothetical protein
MPADPVDPISSPPEPSSAGVAPWGKPLKQKRQRGAAAATESTGPTRDKRWFLRIVAWIVTALGATLLLIAVLPKENPAPSVEGDVISSMQMMALASIPIIAFGLFLLWWGYGKIGEPMVACTRCFHINKPRSTRCAKCAEELG